MRLLLYIFLLGTLYNVNGAPPADLEGEYLLFGNLQAQQYDVHLITYLEEPKLRAFTFEGSVGILFRVLGSTVILRLHAAREMKIHSSSIVVKGVYEKNPRILSGIYHWDNDKEFFDVYTTTALKQGSDYWMNMTFEGTISDDLFGLYKSSYTENGVKKWLATTFFESTGARRAFPCFDEPKWKAKFNLHIAHAPRYHVISNVPSLGDTALEEKPNLEGWVWTHFEQTVPMSTYLVAFVISEFEHITHPDVPSYQVYARPGATNQGDYGNKLAPQIIAYMENYTLHQYSLSKMDQIALPDFVAGAMENWGLVTYRETALLFQEGISAATNKQRVGTVVAHELAHQWFGDLVSPKWWNNMWLNEGFATYYQYRSLETVEKDWQLEQQFVQVEMHAGLQTDSQDNIHPLIEAVENPGGSNPILEDRLVYVKGGSLIRMMVNFMEDSNFKIGINNYLTDRAFNNSDSEDLWRNLQIAVLPGQLPADQDLRDVMVTWAKQPGYPVITVNKDYTSNMSKALVTQERFVMIGSLEETHEELWMVPLTFTSGLSPDFSDVQVKMWLTEPQAELELPASNDYWFICNIKQVGFYRVNYDPINWNLLISALNNVTAMTTIDPINRGQLMDDALALARGKHLDYITALDTTEYLRHETEYMPWAAALSALSYLYDRLNYEQQSRDLIEWYIRSKLEHMYELLGGLNVGEQDSHIMRLTRSLLLGWACKLQHDQCNKHAVEIFAQWKNQVDPDLNNPVAPDVKSIIYCAGMRNGKDEDYDFLEERFDNAFHVATEQAFVLEALACASDPPLLIRLLNASITPDSGIRSQDAKSVFTSVYNNRIGVDVALDFLIENYETAATAYGGMGSIGGMFSGLATKLNTEEQRNKLQSFRDASNSSTLGAAEAGIDAALTTLNYTLQWHADHNDDVVSYFATKRADTGASSAMSPSVLLVCITLLVASCSHN